MEAGLNTICIYQDPQADSCCKICIFVQQTQQKGETIIKSGFSLNLQKLHMPIKKKKKSACERAR